MEVEGFVAGEAWSGAETRRSGAENGAEWKRSGNGAVNRETEQREFASDAK